MAALLASLCFVGYLLIGRKLREWMPVMVYAVRWAGGGVAGGGWGGCLGGPNSWLSDWRADCGPATVFGLCACMSTLKGASPWQTGPRPSSCPGLICKPQRDGPGGRAAVPGRPAV